MLWLKFSLNTSKLPHACFTFFLFFIIKCLHAQQSFTTKLLEYDWGLFVILYAISIWKRFLPLFQSFVAIGICLLFFQSNVCCFSAGPPVPGITCTALAVFTGFSSSLSAIISALATSMGVSKIACITLCLAVSP